MAMTMDEAIKAHMQRVDAGDMDFHHRVGARQEAILRGCAPKDRPGMLDEAWREAVQTEIEVDLYEAALSTDSAWQLELIRRFGKRAGDVRYTPEAHGAEGTTLRRAYDAYRAARDAWETVRNERMRKVHANG